jgi:hypothetical protein
MKKVLQVLIVFILFAAAAYPQTAGLNFTLGFPMGEFKDNVDRAGFGISGDFMFLTPQPEAPFSIGLNLGFMNYGSETRNERFSSTIPDVTVDVTRDNNIANFHLLFRLALPQGIVRPYAEGLFGGSYLFTDTKILSRGSDEVASSTNFDDFAWSYGGGGGFLINLASEPSENVSNIFLDLKVRYLFGSRAEYLKEGSITINNGNVFYDITESKTDLFTVNIGVVAYFTALY